MTFLTWSPCWPFCLMTIPGDSLGCSVQTCNIIALPVSFTWLLEVRAGEPECEPKACSH